MISEDLDRAATGFAAVNDRKIEDLVKKWLYKAGSPSRFRPPTFPVGHRF